MRKKNRLTLLELCVFAMLGTMMFISKLIMDLLPNIHLIGMFTIAFTLTYRVKALVPIYVFVALTGLYGGFAMWWIPYLYVWAVLWAMTMLLPKKMPKMIAIPIYVILCGLHGLMYGTLYAPAQALMYGLNFDGMIAWIIAGLPFDITHACGNLLSGLLIYPVHTVLLKLKRE